MKEKMLHAAHVETGDLDRLFGGHGHVLVQISIPAQQSVGVGPAAAHYQEGRRRFMQVAIIHDDQLQFLAR